MNIPSSSVSTNIKISLRSQVKASGNQVSCDLAGEAAILDLNSGLYYGLDPVGAEIWELVQNPILVSSVVEKLLEEYEVESEQCTDDVIVLLQDLQKHGLIEVVN